MKRIDTTTRALDLFGAGKDGFKDGNLAGGILPTDLNASWFNLVQEELASIVEATGTALDGAVRNQVLQAIRRIAGGSARVKGLIGSNNAGTPNTQYDFTASAVDMRDPATGATYSVQAPASRTCNILTAGPAANGRDQAGAFASSSWVHFYYIYNPTTGAYAVLASASATAPAALPAGYTAWAYASAQWINGSGAMPVTYVRNSWVKYGTLLQVLNGGSAVSPAVVSLASAIPPNAMEYEINIASAAITSTAGGFAALTSYVQVASGSNTNAIGYQMAAAASAVMSVGGPAFRMPNVGQSYYYQNQVSNGAGPASTHNISGYSVPNGA